MYSNYKSFEELPFFLTVEQFAHLLCISKPTAYDLIRAGKVSAIKAGKQFRIPKESIQELISDAESKCR